MILSNKEIKAVLFDLDGTLLDTREGIKNSIKYTIKVLNLPPITDSDLNSFVGPPVQESLKRYFNLSQKQAQIGANIFRNYYKNKSLLQAHIYNGILSLLNHLQSKNIYIGVATYKREDYALTILNYFGISPYCNVICGADDENKLTKANIIDRCISQLQCESKHVVLIGDTEYDAIGAQDAGIFFIAVTWGFGYKGQTPVINYPYIGVAHCPADIERLF